MRIAIVSDHTYLPDRAGGRESSIHELASLYQGLGHDVTVVAAAGSRLRSLLRWRGRLARASAGRPWRPPYRVRRTRNLETEIQGLRERRAVDALILNLDRITRLVDGQCATAAQALYLRDVDSIDLPALSAVPGDTLLVANSSMTAQRYASGCGREVLEVPPLISIDRYATHVSGACVTFVNPLPMKGVEVALGVARNLPDIPFLFVESWPLWYAARSSLRKRLARLPNVQFMDWSLDMRRIYARTRILLVPSQWEEAFCRVVVEAQASGIPAVASRRGGLPATVGDAGVLVNADDPVEVWAGAVRRLWDDHAHRTALAAKALAAAQQHYETAMSRSLGLLRRLEERVAR